MLEPDKNRPNMKFSFFPLIFLLIGSTRSTAQDMHSSQPDLAAVHFNPANTGLFDGRLRGAARYRSQWSSVPVGYKTLAIEADQKFLQMRNSALSLGIRVANDQVGDGQLSYARGGISVGVRQQVTQLAALSVGADLSLAQRNINLNGLKFKSQWNGDIFDPNAPNNEPFGAKTGIFPLISGGIALHLGSSNTQRTYLDFGVALHQINRPEASFQQNKQVRIQSRAVAHMSASRTVRPDLDVVAFAQYQSQGKYQSLVAGGGVRAILGKDGDFFHALQGNLAIRARDAVIPSVQIHWGAWVVGLSYDVNTSPYEVATNNRGGWELATVYRIVPAPKVPEIKVCPVF
jgi:type IX secretion system PorP/SprF family membrane protein